MMDSATRVRSAARDGGTFPSTVRDFAAGPEFVPRLIFPGTLWMRMTALWFESWPRPRKFRNDSQNPQLYATEFPRGKWTGQETPVSI